MNAQNKPQPKPKPPDPNVVPTWAFVIKDMVQRDKIGIKKYGVPLQPNNGRNSLKDAYRECLDMCVYLRNEIEKQKRRRPIHNPKKDTARLNWRESHPDQWLTLRADGTWSVVGLCRSFKTYRKAIDAAMKAEEFRRGV